MANIHGVAQQEKGVFQKIDRHDLYDDVLIAKALSQINTFYWEYRFRELNRFKLDSLFEKYNKIYKGRAREEFNKATALDYKVVFKSTFKNKNDSIRIAAINTHKGAVLSCIPNGNCFYYLISARNDSIQIFNEPRPFHNFFIPIDSYEKAVLWSIWNSYTYEHVFSSSGSYRITPEGIELKAEKTLSTWPTKGMFKSKIALVLLKIDSHGKIRETILKRKRTKPFIMIQE